MVLSSFLEIGNRQGNENDFLFSTNVEKGGVCEIPFAGGRIQGGENDNGLKPSTQGKRGEKNAP